MTVLLTDCNIDLYAVCLLSFESVKKHLSDLNLVDLKVRDFSRKEIDLNEIDL